MTAPVVEIERLAKSFSIPSERRSTVREHVLGLLRPRRVRRLEVLRDVSLRLHPGESLGVMGRNGCGKSTLLRIVAGIYPPDRGAVRVRGELTPILELGLGWNMELDAVDNVHLVGAVMGLTRAEIRARIDEILAFAELERFANLELKHFSSGMSARLAYAIAFHAVRETLVLDEIFAVGDAGFKARCEARFRALHAAGHPVLLVTHDPRVAAEFCARAVLLERGRVVAEGSGAAVAARYLELLAEPAPPAAALA